MKKMNYKDLNIETDSLISFAMCFYGHDKEMKKYQKRIKVSSRILYISLALGLIGAIFHPALGVAIFSGISTFNVPVLMKGCFDRRELHRQISRNDLTYDEFIKCYKNGDIQKGLDYLEKPTRENYIFLFGEDWPEYQNQNKEICVKNENNISTKNQNKISTKKDLSQTENTNLSQYDDLARLEEFYK